MFDILFYLFFLNDKNTTKPYGQKGVLPQGKAQEKSTKRAQGKNIGLSQASMKLSWVHPNPYPQHKTNGTNRTISKEP